MSDAKPTRTIRDIFTGELKEIPYVSDKGGTTVFHYGDKKADLDPIKGIPSIRSDRPHVSTNASIHVDQVDRFNKECVSGVHYQKGTGNLESTSAPAREREARRRGLSFN